MTRYEMGLFKEIADKNDEIVLLKANQYSDNKDAGLQAQISQQAVWNATAGATIGCLTQQIQQLQSMTKHIKMIIEDMHESTGDQKWM